jgi:hypothetical protein
LSCATVSQPVPAWLAALAWAILFALGIAGEDALGASTAQTARESATRFAAIWRIRGEITATGGDTGQQRTLRTGDPVFVGEIIRAGSNAEAVLRIDDAGFMAVRPGAELVVERFAAQGRPSDHLSLRLVKGALRMLTGWIGQVDRAQYRVTTPTATIGIRGTDHEPYAMSADLAAALRQSEGTYDKVNRGGTTMDVNGNRLDIDAGRVGFARAPAKPRTRGLLTLLLPVLLDSVPEFYVPGAFDAELDRLSPTVATDALRTFEERRRADPTPTPPPPGPPDAAPSTDVPGAAPPTAPSQPEATPAAPPEASVQGDCDARAIAVDWLGALDGAIGKRRVLDVIRLFAPDVTVRANVRQKDGTFATLEMDREELARSTVAALSALTEHSQRRPSIEATLTGAAAGKCLRISVRSVSIEQGRQGGLAYRFEALEEYVLELRANRWVAISAVTTQR